MHIQKDDEQTIIRFEQEKRQKRSTRPRKRKNIIHDLHLMDLKNLYEQNLVDIQQYQKIIRKISYAYMNIFENTMSDDDSI